jgi:pimeloyl-ACP methyl ester carboxylesterase
MSPPTPGCASAGSRSLLINGIRLHFLEWGVPGRPALCLLHGGAAHAHWFDLVAPALAGRYHVVALDQRGHGQSDWVSPPAYATEDFAADLLGLADALGWGRVTLVGHSMGGHNAMAFAAWHPGRSRALVIADSRPSIPDDRLTLLRERGHRPLRHHPTVDAAAGAFRLLPRSTVAEPWLLDHLAREGVVQRDGGWVYRFDPQTSASRQPVNAWQLLDRIAAPTLVIRAELSPILTAETAERLRQAIRGAAVAVVPGAYHHLMLDRPVEFTRALASFLDALPA